MLTSLTSFQSIRSVLGLSTKELPDALLEAEVYDLTLETEVLELGATAFTDYTTATTAGTTEADAYVRALRLFATHVVAFKCLEALPLFSSKAITDGKAGVYRDGNSPYKTTIAQVTAAYFLSKRRAREAFATYSGAPLAVATPFTLMGVSSPNSDPVTGT